MNEAGESISKVFTKISHHRNVSILFLTQNIFDRTNKYMRTMSLNAHYLILFKNPRDTTQFIALARQMYGSGYQYAVEAYRDATSHPFSYLLIDLRGDTEEQYRLRTNIFPHEQTYVYVRKL